MSYLYWRGKSLWCRYQLPGHPEMFPLEILHDGIFYGPGRDAKSREKRRSLLYGPKRTENRLFDIKQETSTFTIQILGGWSVVIGIIICVSRKRRGMKNFP